MQSPKLLVKVAVLSGFILLLSGFVAYRSGFFDRFLYSPNGGNSLSNTQYNLPAPGHIFPGSDTGRLRIFIPDTVMKKYNTYNERVNKYMSSSKSIVVAVPESIKDNTLHPVVVNGQLQFYSFKNIDSLLALNPLIENAYPISGNEKLRVTITDTILNQYLQASKKEREYMTSSKSGMLPRSTHPARKRYPLSINGEAKMLTVPQIDSLFSFEPVIDTIPSQPVPSKSTSEPIRTPSTKSGRVFRPDDLEKQKKKDKKKNNQ